MMKKADYFIGTLLAIYKMTQGRGEIMSYDNKRSRLSWL